MWLSKNTVSERRTDAAETGITTIGGSVAGVYTDTENRNVRVCTPGGYFWMPTAGEELLVIKDSGGSRSAAGVVMPQPPEDLAAGEIYIRSAGGCGIHLKNDGRVVIEGEIELSGRVDVRGGLYVDGTKVE